MKGLIHSQRVFQFWGSPELFVIFPTKQTIKNHRKNKIGKKLKNGQKIAKNDFLGYFGYFLQYNGRNSYDHWLNFTLCWIYCIRQSQESLWEL